MQIKVERQLLLFDFPNLVIRHHHNLHNQAVAPDGRPMRGAAGALRQILRLIGQRSPSDCLVALDCPRHEGFRVGLDPSYKQTRSAADPDLKANLEVAERALRALDIAVARAPSHEADDVMASAAKKFPGRATIVTGDKDLLAACSDKVQVMLLRPGGVLTCGPDECEQITGISPDRLPDLKALMGDSSDNIKGMPGVGEKRALKLLDIYKDFPTIISTLKSKKSLASLTDRVISETLNIIDQVEVSLQLVQLVDNLEIDFEQSRAPVLDPRSVRAKLEPAGLEYLI